MRVSSVERLKALEHVLSKILDIKVVGVEYLEMNVFKVLGSNG